MDCLAKFIKVIVLVKELKWKNTSLIYVYNEANQFGFRKMPREEGKWVPIYKLKETEEQTYIRD